MEAADTILLIEDNDDDSFMFERALATSHCHAVARRVASVPEAIEAIKAGLRPRLVFLDLFLPNLGGVHFLQWIRAEPDCQCIPVIVFAGVIRRQTMTDLCALGANAVMVKPMEYEQLTEGIGHACRFWLNFCVPPRGFGDD